MLMLGGWTSIFRKAKENGFDLTVVQRLHAVKPDDLAFVDQLLTSPLNEAGVVDLVAAIHRDRPFDAVVSFQELGLLNAARIAQRLGIAGNPLEPVMLTRDKAAMREHMKAHGIPSIPFAVVLHVEEAIAFGNAQGWPIILKPANGVGSLHIHKLAGPEQVADAFASINSDPIVVRLIKKEFPDLRIIAEKFVEGPEVSVEAISWDGAHTVLIVTDKRHSGSPAFVETGHSMPSLLPAATLDAVRDMTRDFLSSIGHRHGPSHTEVIISEQGPIIVESHTRSGGDHIFDMVELACGIDLFDATLKGFSGAFPELTLAATQTVAVRYWMPPAGTVAAVTGVELARNASGVVRCDLNLKPGDTTRPLRYSDDRPGYILAVGTGQESAVENIDRAMRMVTITLAEETPGGQADGATARQPAAG